MTQTPSNTVPSSRFVRRIATLLPISLVAFLSAAAQDPQPVLPNLAPREVEIRGQLVIQFPALERQPLIGFNPPPRIPTIPTDRRPIVEEYKQSRADLPQTEISRPSPPGVLLPGAAFLNGELEAAGGSYFDRKVRGRFGGDLSQAVSGVIKADYFGSDGQTIDTTLAIKNPLDSFDGSAGVYARLGGLRLGSEIKGSSRSYTLYGLRPADNPLSTSFFDNLPSRQLVGGSVGFSVDYAIPSGVATQNRVTLGLSRVATDPDSSGILNAYTLDDRRVRLSSATSVPLGGSRLEIGLHGSFASGSSDADNAVLSTPVSRSEFLYRGTLGVRRSGPRANLAVGAAILGTAVDDDVDSAGPKRKLSYLTPSVDLEYYPTSGLTVFARNTPEAVSTNILDVFRDNPFLSSDVTLQPSLKVVQADAGISLSIAPLQVRLSGGYDWSPNWLYFDRVTRAGIAGFFEPQYAKARVYRGDVAVDADLTGSLHASVGASYQDGMLTETDTAVPYLPKWSGTGTLGYRLLERRLLLQAEGQYTGTRIVSVGSDVSADAVVSLNAHVLFNVTRSIGLTFSARNILDDPLEYWQGYPGVGRQFLGGFRLLW